MGAPKSFYGPRDAAIATLLAWLYDRCRDEARLSARLRVADMWAMPAADAQSVKPPVRTQHRSLRVRAQPATFAAVYSEHHQALYRYCRSILRDDEDAKDALQSTMARAFAALQTEDRDFELRPWLFRIAHNESISVLRARRPLSALEDAAGIAEETLERRVDDRQNLALLQADLSDLPDQQRSALVMRELNGLPHGEIAEVLGVSPGAAKQAIFEARTALHQCREGRAMACEDIFRLISDADGRVLRGRGVRAHLRSCRRCRDFAASIRERPADLAALAPPLPAAAAAAMLAHIVPGAKLAALGAATASSTSVIGGAIGAKSVAGLAILVAAAGSGTLVATHHGKPSPSSRGGLQGTPLVQRSGPAPRGTGAGAPSAVPAARPHQRGGASGLHGPASALKAGEAESDTPAADGALEGSSASGPLASHGRSGDTPGHTRGAQPARTHARTRTRRTQASKAHSPSRRNTHPAPAHKPATPPSGVTHNPAGAQHPGKVPDKQVPGSTPPKRNQVPAPPAKPAPTPPESSPKSRSSLRVSE